MRSNLRAQTIGEPMRSSSLGLLRRYADTSIALSAAVPTSEQADKAVGAGAAIQRQLWTLAGQALSQSPVDSAPRLYVESLNQMIETHATRVAALDNRVPSAVLALEVFGAAVALGLLAVYLSILGGGIPAILLGAAVVTMLLLTTFDLDRPTRGLIPVPASPLVSVRASMELPPAAAGPSGTSGASGG
jgi:hypothetical protein